MEDLIPFKDNAICIHGIGWNQLKRMPVINKEKRWNEGSVKVENWEFSDISTINISLVSVGESKVDDDDNFIQVSSGETKK